MSRSKPAGRNVSSSLSRFGNAAPVFETLEDRRLFSFVPIAGAVDSAYHDYQGVALAVFPGEGPATATAVAAAAGGEAIVAGTIIPSNPQQQFAFAFAKFTSGGLLDQSFGSGGEVVIHTPDYCMLNDAIVTPDGKVVFCGTETDTVSVIGRKYAVIGRLNPDGSLDQSFGTGGFVIDTFDDPGNPTRRDTSYDHVAMEGGDHLLVEGNFGGQGYLRSYDSTGHLVTNYAQGGLFTLNTGQYDYVRGIASGNHGVYLAGQTDTIDIGGASDTNFLVAHLTNAGAPDTNYSLSRTGAYIRGYNDGLTEYATDVIIRPDGTVVASSNENGIGYLRFAGNDGASVGTPFSQAQLPFSVPIDIAAQKTNQVVALDDQGVLHQFAANGAENINFEFNNGPATGDTDSAPVGLAIDSNDNVLTIGTRNGGFYIKRFFGHGPAGLPAAPTGLVATATGPGQVTLTWKDNSNNETGFTVQKTSGFFLFPGGTDLPAGATQYTFSGLTAGKTYYFRVRAFNDFGRSHVSNTVTFKVPAHADKKKFHHVRLSHLTSRIEEQLVGSRVK